MSDEKMVEMEKQGAVIAVPERIVPRKAVRGWKIKEKKNAPAPEAKVAGGDA